ncbi:hypothetical protein NDU88_001972 [Pleurodeles waltl]|uniref:Uncharacterized protein n=1 Tax=Pleurodeles waltl TaxID=8319 RepID=A0AAV7WJY2_PLEWA|nr:hypothetical protein NDU88_001972 [Pleurodeles waltl]
MEDAPRCPGSMSLALAGHGGTSGVGLAYPEVFSGPDGDADREGSAGLLNGLKHTGDATTGRGNSPEPDDGSANGDDHSRLLHFGRGNKEEAMY